MKVAPYFLQELHKNLQRTVSLALCTSSAPRVRPITAERLASLYSQSLQASVSIAPTDTARITSYIAERALVRKYAKTGVATIEAIKSRLERGDQFIDAQDWHLSDPRLPSATGVEKDDSFVKTVAACTELGLLDDKTLTVEPYGDLLVTLAEERGIIARPANGGHNPFLPEPAYAGAAYFRIASYDYIFQRELLRIIPQAGTTFTSLCTGLAGLLGRVATEVGVSLNQSNRAAQRWLDARLKAAEELNKRVTAGGWKESPGVSIQTLYRPFEDVLLPRLEFLVDYGVLRKPNPGRYEYVPASGFEALKELLEQSADALTARFFSVTAKVHSRTSRPITEPIEVLDHLRPGFLKFKGLTGYAPIAESTVYSNMICWDMEPWPVVEIGVAHEALRQLALIEPPATRILADRFRRPHTFAILKAANG